MGQFPEVEASLDLPSLDARVLELWRERKVFERSLERRIGAPLFVFYEGPPTANGRPGVHHVEARVFKDLFPRFKTMRGYRVERKGGWDCHGLPVELEVEKELGLNSKRDIEAFGVEAFNARCRESVERYVDAFEELTERIGFWIDTSQAYWTMDASYVASVWWALAGLHARGLLVEDYKVVPYCPRCETALSDAEVAMGYRQVEDLTAYVVLPATSGTLAAEGAGLLVWTTQPWTLVPNVSVVVGPHIEYVLVEAERDGARRKLVVARDLVEAAVGPDALLLRPVPLSELVGTRYQRAFDMIPVTEEEAARGWRVVTDEYVTTTDGSGLVQTSPAYGAEDLAVGQRYGTPVLHPVGPDGRFGPETGWLAGKFVKDADAEIVEDLRRRGLLWRAEPHRHAYPFCWRCGTPLIYYALTSWYARTTAVKERMLAENSKIGWQPEHIREGRFGDWLAHNVDWALSRARYWGTPLPLWRCPQGHVTAVSSLADLSARAGRDLSGLDPHRPYVDEVAFDCPQCGAEARRVPDVLDAWFDSGSMPFAQWGYPHRGREAFERAFPADFISEAIDQTRGWFYSLLAVSTLLFDRTAYRSVVCLGLIVDRDGRKMSKSLGNALDPFELLDSYGADPLRWFMLASGSPWVARRLSPEVLEEVTRSLFLTLWNTYGFFMLYARLAGFDPTRPAAAAATPLDRWALAELADAVAEVTERLDAYDPATAGRRLATLVDDLSNWYVRLSRRRFWRGAGEDAEAAFRTLWTCLRTLSLLLAPYVPFVAEALWQGLVVAVDPDAPDSVHLADWPEPDSAAADDELRAAMAEARRLVGLGRQARTEARVKVRQPLARALVSVPATRREAVAGLLDLVAAELNVKEVRFADGEAGLVAYRLNPNFRAIGPRFGKDAPAVAAAVRAADAARLAPRLAAGERVEVEVPGRGPVDLGQDEVGVVEEPVTGWRVARDGGSSVALDLEATPELRREGLARELVRAVQELRREAGLRVSDRIELAVRAEGEAAEAVEAHRDYLLGETLAVELFRAPQGDGFDARVDLDGQEVRLWLRPVATG
ncbi:MAG TPA: isoleucine--tRNA ligase [Actinomycetota bacterium]|jgi:isoleucyl-tRNA synthetase|nr:isoleucine--tRNA ligase [Actinomycetota bacterium]